ncbi:MAG: polyprenyl diphosphate synthase [Candidatus Bathyarchaeia archaeon]
MRALGIYKIYEKALERQVKSAVMPEHIAVILDGNRRWAEKHAMDRSLGHYFGARRGVSFLEWCLDLGIKTVTVYVFSKENFRRPPEEVAAVFKVVEEQLENLARDPRIHQKRVKVKAIGRTDELPETLQRSLRRVEELTESYDNFFFNIAIAYGGRAEIVDAAKKLGLDLLARKVSVEQIDENSFMKYLYTSYLPNPYPDLVIRTSGEERLSGFLLWQTAYSELSFLDVYWPDFRKIDLLRAIRTYQHRKRRFGG